MRVRELGRDNPPVARGIVRGCLLLALASCAPATSTGVAGDHGGTGGAGGAAGATALGTGGERASVGDAASEGTFDARDPGDRDSIDSGSSGHQGDGGASAQDAGRDTAGAAASDAEAGPDPLNASSRCSSNKSWANASGDNQNMRPGEACPVCHTNFQLAGTIYPTGHEPDDCDGVDGLSNNVVVVITDAAGVDHTLYPNSVGNFYTSITIVPPFHAKVVWNGKERAMAPAQTSGSCNVCHTQMGANAAPGRITMPF
jgi:hypothetical protein